MQCSSFGTDLKGSATRHARKARGAHGCNMYSLEFLWINTSQLLCFPVWNTHCQQELNCKLFTAPSGGSSSLLHFCWQMQFVFFWVIPMEYKYAVCYRDNCVLQKWPMGVTVFPPLQVKTLVKNIFSLVKSYYLCFLSTVKLHTMFQPNLFYPRLI